MDFLPKDEKELQDQSYWKKFFEFEKFQGGFEWYADFVDLEYYLKQFIKSEDQKILVPGCGNSDLSQKIAEGKLGVKNLMVESVDYEEQVIKKMEDSKPEGLNLNYKYGDCTDLSPLYQAGTFDVAVDKGTLDAIATDVREETIKMCQAYFNEMLRVLNDKNGTLVIVSLLQPHVLKIILDFFVKENDVNHHQLTNLFQVKIQRIDKIEGYAEKQFIKYFVSIKKNFIDTSNQKMVDMRVKLQDSVGLKDGKDQKEEFFNREMASEKIKVDQQIFMVAPTLKQLDGERDISMLCFDQKANAKLPKYTIYVVDSKDADLRAKRSCAAVIVPQGQETASVFSTEMGRQGLCSQVQVARLIVICLGNGFVFNSLKEVQDELNGKILDLAPSRCSNIDQIPFMTTGEDIGQKSLIDVLTEDKIEGIIVQDLRSSPGVALRQVIYESKYDQIQSEIQIVYRDPKKHELKEHQLATSEICPKKKGKTSIFNHEYISNEYQQGMLAGLFLSPQLRENTDLKILHLGTGAGIMPMFLRNQLGDSLQKLVTIDNNADMLKIAEKYFGFHPDEKLVSLCEDAFTYVESSTEKDFDIIIMDINFSEDDKNISPPWRFLETAFLEKLLALGSKNAYVCLNVLYYDETSKNRVHENINNLKISLKCLFEPEESNNKVFLLSKSEDFSILDVEENQKGLESVLKGWGVSKALWMKEMEMGEHVKQIKKIMGKKMNVAGYKIEV